MTGTDSQILIELKTHLRSIYSDRLTEVILFGSRARGTADDSSDYDVLVVLDGTVEAAGEIQRTGPVVAELSLKYDVVIAPLFVSAARYSVENSPLMLNVRVEGVAL